MRQVSQSLRDWSDQRNDVCSRLNDEDSASEVQPLLCSQPSAELGSSDQVLNRLSDLEAYSGYARRTLDKYFQGRFGMGPMQWIRRQRLLHARQLIESSGGQIKLGAIAQSCGYHNRASFSRDFHQVFGEKASDLVRRCTS